MSIKSRQRQAVREAAGETRPAKSNRKKQSPHLARAMKGRGNRRIASDRTEYVVAPNGQWNRLEN
jgi:hypothetical protein